MRFAALLCCNNIGIILVNEYMLWRVYMLCAWHARFILTNGWSAASLGNPLRVKGLLVWVGNTREMHCYHFYVLILFSLPNFRSIGNLTFIQDGRFPIMVV